MTAGAVSRWHGLCGDFLAVVVVVSVAVIPVNGYLKHDNDQFFRPGRPHTSLRPGAQLRLVRPCQELGGADQ